MNKRYLFKISLVDVDTLEESGEVFSRYSVEESGYSMAIDNVVMSTMNVLNENIRIVLSDHIPLEHLKD